MRTYILDDNMNPVPADTNDAFEWISKHPDKHRVGKTTFSDGTWVSTVFLTLDHSFNDGLPLLWETMVFGKDSYSETFCDRYHTYEQAVQGHKDAVAQTLQSLIAENPDANIVEL